MKKYIIIFLLTSIPSYFFAMVEPEKGDFKKNLKIMLEKLRTNFNRSEPRLNHKTATTVRQIIESASIELDKKKMKKSLENISQEILEGLKMLRNALNQRKIEQQILKKLTQKPKRPIMQQLPPEQRLSVKIEEFVAQII